MSRLSIAPLLIGALVGTVLFVAGGQTVIQQLALLGSPPVAVAPQIVLLPTNGVTAGNIVLSTASTRNAINALAIDTLLTPTLAQPKFVCRSCTPVPLPTATPNLAVEPVTPAALTPTDVPPPPSPPALTPPVSSTPLATNLPALTPSSSVVTATATSLPPPPPPTDTLPTALPASATPGVALATATVAVLPTTVPAPPAATATIQLWMASDFDPTGQVYRSRGTAISWPAGEVLSFAPAITLSMPSTPDPALAYRARVVAWSLVSSGGQSVLGIDAMGHAGCRLHAEPAPADARGLAGCHYRYLEHPTLDDMTMQAHAFWSAGTPLSMCIDVHTYDLGQVRDTDLTLQVAIRTETIAVATGEILASATEIKTATIAIHLAVPRSTR